MNTHFHFDHYIRRKTDGAIYTGRVSSTERPDYEFSQTPMDWLGYSEAGAHRKVGLFPGFFANCEIVHL